MKFNWAEMDQIYCKRWDDRVIKFDFDLILSRLKVAGPTFRQSTGRQLKWDQKGERSLLIVRRKVDAQSSADGHVLRSPDQVTKFIFVKYGT